MLKITLNADNNTIILDEETWNIYQRAMSLLTELYYDYEKYDVFQDEQMEEVKSFLSGIDQI